MYESGPDNIHRQQNAKKEVEQKRYSRESVDEAWRKLHFEVNGRQVELYGVLHVPETLEVDEYRETLKQAIARASLVVIESMPTASGMHSERFIKFILEMAEKSSEKISREPIVNFFETEKSGRFFRQIENFAANLHKKAAMVDPWIQNIEHPVVVYDLLRRDSDVLTTKTVLGMLGTIAFAFYNLTGNKANIKNEQTDNSPGLSGKSGLTRRQFLKGLSGAVMGGGWLSSMASVIDSSSGISVRGGRADNPLGPFLYNLLDYRDVTVAKGLDILTKKELGEGPIVMIYGAGHASAIRHYAEASLEREAKYTTYAPYRSVDPPQLHTYEFDASKKEWVTVEMADIL